MAMTWDAVLVSALAGELNELLKGARLRGHRFRWEERELSLYFREGTLRWQLHPRRGWVTFRAGDTVPEDARPLSAEVTEVRAPPDDRLLEIHLQRRRGKSRLIRLVVELLTNQWNALLLEGQEGWIRHLLWTRRLDERTLAVGHRYVAPPHSARRGARDPLTAGEWDALLGKLSPSGARRTLLEEVAFTSPINVSWLLGPGEDSARDQDGVAGGGTAPDSRHEKDPEGRLGSDSLVESFHRWMQLRSPPALQPCLLETRIDKQPYPIVLKDLKSTPFPNLITAIEAVSRDQEGGLDSGEEVAEKLERALHKARGRARGIRKEMAEASDPEEPRGHANLLLARLGKVSRGVAFITLEGFGGEEVQIPLDPSLSPQENVQALYREASRRERARDRLPPLLKEAEEAVQALEVLQNGLSQGSISFRETAARIPGERRSGVPGRRREARIPFRRYFSSGGLEIRVGRSSKENDTLTFRYSHPEDIWLHARDRAGAHVILRWRTEGNPPQRDLAEAAILAALHSGARGSGMVPVDWTRRKYVRKARKSPAGTVIPERTLTLFVEPDPELPKRLKEQRPETAE